MLEQSFSQQLQQTYHTPQHFLIAFSGGLDSTALLALFKKFCQNQPLFHIRAIHIHHGLSPNADSWLAHCRQICALFDVPFIAEKVQLKRSQGIEADAREARYQAFKAHLRPNETLVTAHHQQDQSESFLLALKRGSGLQGLGAMQAQSQLFAMPIFRPLLNFSRQQLEAYVQQQQLSWIEDESNLDNRYDRNFLRNQVLPLLRQRWDFFDKTLQRSAQHCYEQQQLINELLAPAFAQCYRPQDQSLNLEPFNQFSNAKQAALLRFWLQRHKVDMPSTSQLEQLRATMLAAAQDKQPEFKLGDNLIRRYQKRLFLTPIYQDLSDLCLTIRIGETLQLPDNLGKLTLQKKSEKLTALWRPYEAPTAVEDNEQAGLLYQSEFASPQQQFVLKFLYSGRVKLSPNTPSRDIKKIWQQHKLPVWQRGRIPYLFEQQATGLKLKCAVGFFVAP